ncbi:sigma-70 family RNA polymerase sigma factor [Glycomyces sp. NRRL B-16210]|uniref:sigma-70 family RNA polymerase sigma factor n=1 Tax=Glycomyces sp. NRRL B-16210 TaxID=1463821 RepID=UPI0004BF4E55|nr:sigma-70 family RNA polymerase sigma factor [Glycomyces sp. NRRL B-16210]
MSDEFTVQRFEEHREHLRAVAYRMLGSSSEADDAVQETWMRFARTDTADVENLRGWLTTVVSRICLNLLRSRRTRREDALDAEPPQIAASDPEADAVMADSVGLALQVVLDSLNPAERLAFVLHDLFGVPFDRIAQVLDRTPEATRQLASRARRHVREGRKREGGTDSRQQKTVVEAFLAAAREGRFEDLLEVLDPDIVVVADEAAVATGFGGREVLGAKAVAELFNGKAAAAVPVLIDGSAGAMWAPGGKPRSVLAFTIAEGRIAGIAITNDPETIATLELETFES